MKEKKSKSKNIEKHKFIFFEIGLIVALGVVFCAFEYSTPKNNTLNLGVVDYQIENDILIPITTIEKPLPELPEPKVETPLVFDIKKNDEVVTDTINFSSEADENTKISPIIKFIENKDEKKDETQPLPWALIETKPKFPGGDVALMKFIGKNTKYPHVPKEEGIQGKVYIQFVISKTGKVENVTVIRPIDPYLDAEAIRVISILPTWSPGLQGVNPVDCVYIIPINFILSN